MIAFTFTTVHLLEQLYATKLYYLQAEFTCLENQSIPVGGRSPDVQACPRALRQIYMHYAPYTHLGCCIPLAPSHTQCFVVRSGG